MRIARRTFLASSIGTVAAPALLRVALGDTPTTLRLHHAFSSVSGVHDKFLTPWARKVEAESGGRLRVDIFPSMQLGGAPAALFDQVRDGTADIVWAPPSLTPGRFPKIETFELPFLPSRRALVSSKALTDFAAVNLQDEFRDFHTICFSCSDRAAIHATRPVRTIEDIKDLKLHVQTRFAAEAMRALGAYPVMMPSGQLPVAISEHVIDGCLDPWHLVPPLRLNEQLRSHTEFSDQSPGARTYVLAMSKAAYDQLPRELKVVIDSNSGHAAATMAGSMWDLQAAAVANMVVERGDLIVTLLPEAVARWRRAAEPVIDAWRKEIKQQKIDGAKLLLTAHALLAKYATEPEPQASPTAPPAQQAVAQPQPPQPQPPQPAPNGMPKFSSQSPSTAPSQGPPVGSAARSASPAPQQPAPQGLASKPPAVAATPAPTSPPPLSAGPPPTAPSAAAAPAKPLAAPTTPMSAPATAPSTAPITAPMSTPAAPTAIPAPAPAVAPQPSIAVAPPPPTPPTLRPVPKALDIPL